MRRDRTLECAEWGPDRPELQHLRSVGWDSGVRPGSTTSAANMITAAAEHGNLVYVGDTPAPNGQRRPHSHPAHLLSQISKDSVRQFFGDVERQRAGRGRRAYDLMYVRRPATASPLLDADRAAIVALDSVCAFVAEQRHHRRARSFCRGRGSAAARRRSRSRARQASARFCWWPADGSRTRITSFTRHIDELSGDDKSAFLRATSTLAWETTKAGKTTVQTVPARPTLSSCVGGDGRWRIVRQMWNPLP